MTAWNLYIWHADINNFSVHDSRSYERYLLSSSEAFLTHYSLSEIASLRRGIHFALHISCYRCKLCRNYPKTKLLNILNNCKENKIEIGKTIYPGVLSSNNEIWREQLSNERTRGGRTELLFIRIKGFHMIANDRRRSQRELFPYNRRRSQTAAEPTVAIHFVQRKFQMHSRVVLAGKSKQTTWRTSRRKFCCKQIYFFF